MGESRGRRNLSSQQYGSKGACNTIEGNYGRKAKRGEYAKGLLRREFAKDRLQGTWLLGHVACCTYLGGRWD